MALLGSMLAACSGSASNGFVTAAGASTSSPILFQTQIDASGVLHYPGNDPPITAALLEDLRAKAEQDAKTRCHGLLGDYTLLAKTFEGELEESILTYSLPTSYLCGRTVVSTDEVVPTLIASLAGDDSDTAQDLLVKAGAPAVVPLLEVARDITGVEEQRRDAMRTLADFLDERGEYLGDLYLHILGSLIPVIADENDSVNADAADAFAHHYGAAAYAQAHRDDFSTLGYARVVYAICGHWKQNSSYAVGVDELDRLLDTQDPAIASYALLGLDARGFTDDEASLFLPHLAAYAEPRSALRTPDVFRVLAKVKDPKAADLVVAAIDPTLLEGEPDVFKQSFLFQAMLALKNFVEDPTAKTAVPHLKTIAASRVNPDNPYLQTAANELLGLLGGPAPR
jgi:hypothetical protein